MTPNAHLDRPKFRQPGDPLRVVIVDDDRDIALGLKEIIEDLGDEAYATFSGGGAIELTSATHPDVLLLDLSLPDASGLTVAAAVRALEHRENLKIIAVTGLSDDQSRRQTAEAGFDLHLTKPIRLGVLESMLDLLRSAPAVA